MDFTAEEEEGSPLDPTSATAFTFRTKSRLCFICTSVISSGEDTTGDEEAIAVEVFLKGLTIICNKLVIDSKYGTSACWNFGGGINHNSFVKYVCCKGCCGILNSIVTLHQMIISSELSLNENIQRIQNTVTDSAKANGEVEYSINSCFHFRHDLLKRSDDTERGQRQVSEKKRPQRTTSRPGPASSKRGKQKSSLPLPTTDNSSSNLTNYNSCYVKIEKFEGCISSQEVLSEPQLDQPVFDDPIDDKFAENEEFEHFMDYDSKDTDANDEMETDPTDILPLPHSVFNDPLGDDDNDEDYKPRYRRRNTGGKRGRPKKVRTPEEMARMLIKRKRGRPAKPKPVNQIVRKRGRPTKPKPLEEIIKRPRGRPKSVPEVTIEEEPCDPLGILLTTPGIGVDSLSPPVSDVEDNKSITDDNQSDSDYDPDETDTERVKEKAKTTRTSVVSKTKRLRRTGQPGRPRKKITIKAAKEMLQQSINAKPVLIVDAEKKEYSFFDVRFQKDGTTLVCNHPNCNFFVDGVAYFADQLAFRTMKLHIRHIHRVKRTAESEESKSHCYCCSFCIEYFSSKCDLIKHIRFAHANAKKLRIHCEACGYGTVNHSLMSEHLLDHKSQQEKALIFEEKAKRPARKKDTTMPLHFPCDQCDKVCVNQTLLRIHKISHVPIELRKQFQCDTCGIKLSSENSLNLHKLRIHLKSMKYPFVCRICGKKYNSVQKSRYETHMRLHTGERPFQCSDCGKSFRDNYNLHLHQKTHINMNIQCEFCTNVYKSDKYLRRHHYKHHPEHVKRPNKSETLKYTNDEHRPDFIGPKLLHVCEPHGKVYVFKSQLIAHFKHGHKMFFPKSQDYPEQYTFEMQQQKDLETIVKNDEQKPGSSVWNMGK